MKQFILEDVLHGPGANIIIGNLLRPGIDIGLEDPWGNSLGSVKTGSKPEYGDGGFEFLAGQPASGYKLHVVRYDLGVESEQVFAFSHRIGVTRLVFSERDSQPEPIDPDSILMQPGVKYSVTRDGDEAVWQEGELEDAIWVLVGYHLPGTNQYLRKREPILPLLAGRVTEMRIAMERLEKVIKELRG